MQSTTTESIEFHGFCDASLHVYAAAIYIRVTDHERSYVALLAAKTKVAPLKQIAILRLELCGALLLSRLLNTVFTSMGFKKAPTHAWTDSKIVLAWFTGYPTRWTCFVANRVSVIQSSELSIAWHHVLSKDNPADCASRGLNPSELSSNDLWWHGPAWLQKSPFRWPKDRTSAPEDKPPEKRRTVHVHLSETPKEDELLVRYSSLRKLLRVPAYCRRFVSNVRVLPHLRISGFLSALELSDARTLWIRNVQLTFFGEEFEALRSNKPLPKRSPHAYPPLHHVLSFPRTRRDAANGRHVIGTHHSIQTVFHHWILLRRPDPAPSDDRTRFPSHKDYVALFVCLSTKAIHLKAVTDYSTAALLAAYRRFVARRGLCSEIWSDNGTNFKGADQELRTMLQQVSSHLQEGAQLVANDGTQWRFIPPAAPHFGGIWVARVKSTKYHLKRFIGDTVLTFEELSTVLAQIEACLNSRPISPLTSDSSDVTALTPGHFFIGRPLTSIPEPSLTDVPVNRLSRL